MEQAGRLAAEWACRRLAAEFAIFIDQRRYDEFVGLFCADALYKPRQTAYVGHDGIRRYLDSRPGNRISRHLISNHVVNVSDDLASATGYCNLVYFAHEGDEDPTRTAAAVQPVAIGDYHDTYKRTEAGWLISSRIGHIVFDRQVNSAGISPARPGTP